MTQSDQDQDQGQDQDQPGAPPIGLRPEIDISKWLWLAPAIMLLVAVLPLPYVYYIALRWIVAGAAGFIAWKEFALNNNAANSYVWIFAAIALVFNPIFPVHLFRLAWIAIGLFSAAAFIGHYKLRQESE
ncbi:MAG: hypothetical protein ACJA2X_001019 [Halocynthiibacter sp.]|jgi:hypothetical protein